MIKLCAIAGMLIVACAHDEHVDPKPLPEQMPQGREICKALCASYRRPYQEYRYDGKCVCGSQ